jgi:chemotaxis protein MotB
MMSRSMLAVSITTLSLAALLTGCGPDGREMQIQALQADKNRLMMENEDLAQRLADAQADADRTSRRALELQSMLDDARRQLAAGRGSDLPEGWTGTDTFAWTDLAENILFDSGKAELKSTARSELEKVIRTIQSEFAGREIWVVGHTDSDPIRASAKLWKDNLDLSANRAMAVVREMQRLGVDAQRLTAAGQGEHHPKAPNTTRANKAINRRVQIIAVTVPRSPMTESTAGSQ